MNMRLRVWFLALAVLSIAILNAQTLPARADDYVRPKEPEPGRLAIDTLYTYWGDHRNATYVLGDTILTFTADGQERPRKVTLAISAPGTRAQTFVMQEENFVDIAFGVGRLDPKARAAQVMTVTYTGGAHCCEAIDVFTPAAYGWTKSTMGEWDGDVTTWPKDLDGDGYADLIERDNRFLYQFSSYAESWAPPVVLNLVDGRAVDVSRKPAFSRLFAADMARARPECEKAAAGACSAFVADAARLGQKDQAWEFMTAHEPKKAPAFAAEPWRTDACPGVLDPEIKDPCPTQDFKTYPEALDWFLRQTGYIS